MSDFAVEPTLFGIRNSNRAPKDFWGKNQFNSAFPTALACWMRHRQINPVYVHTHGGDIVASDEALSFDDVFNSKADTDQLRFDFETKFQPFQAYAHDQLDSIDLVVSEDGHPKKALEIKLTVLPDNNTCSKAETDWGCELVIRPVSVIYAAMTIYDALSELRQEALDLIQDTALDIRDWANPTEIAAKRTRILSAVGSLLDRFSDLQTPLVMQPVWKTNGKQPDLAEQAFDIFVWSNMALCRLFLNQALTEKPTQSRVDTVSRHLRASARLLRALYELLTVGKMRSRAISDMALGNQTDKEFAASGTVTNPYMRHPRLAVPCIPRTDLRHIILNGGEKHLSPERRFDASIYFTAMELFENLA